MSITTVSDSTTNPIFSYRASEELATDSWGTLVRATVNLKPLSWDTVAPTFKGWESDYKGATGLPLPDAWRSAKSVLKSAITHDVAIVNAAGEPLGKSAVEADIKATKGAPSDKNPADVLVGLVSTCYAYAVKHDLDTELRALLHDSLCKLDL